MSLWEIVKMKNEMENGFYVNERNNKTAIAACFVIKNCAQKMFHNEGNR